MLYEHDREKSESDKFIADPSPEYSSLNEFTARSDVPEDDLLAQETERLSSIIIDIEETDDPMASSSGSSPGNKKSLSGVLKALIAICGAATVTTFIYNLFNRNPQRMDFLSTLNPADRRQASDLIEVITQFSTMNSSSAPKRMTAKESLLHLLIGSSIARYPEESGVTEKLTSVQLANSSLPYALSTPITPALLSATKKNIVTADMQQPTPLPDTNDTFAPLLNKQEMEDIYQLEQRPHVRHTRDSRQHSTTAEPESGYVSYTQAIKLLFLDKLSREYYVSYTKFLEPYSNDFFKHYGEFSKGQLKLPELTIHLYNVFNKIFIKKLALKSAPKSGPMNIKKYFVLHALLNLSLALKNKIDPEHSRLRIIDSWASNDQEIDDAALYKYMNWMTPVPAEPLEEGLYSAIMDIQGGVIDKIKSANNNNRIKKIPKLLKINTDTLHNIQAELDRRDDHRYRPGSRSIGWGKVSGWDWSKIGSQSSELLTSTQTELQEEYKQLSAELEVRKKYSETEKHNYPEKEIENLRKIKSYLDDTYFEMFSAEKEYNNNHNLTDNIHDRMAELIPSIILEIGINLDLSQPIAFTTNIPYDFNKHTLNLAKQHLYSLHQDMIIYDYALNIIKQQPSLLSNTSKNRRNNYLDIYAARKDAVAYLKFILKEDSPHLSSAEANKKLVNSLIDGDDYYSRLYLILAAVLYQIMIAGQIPPSPDSSNVQRMIDKYQEASYRLDKINTLRKEPDNFISIYELKSNLYFESQTEYNEQFSDYKGSSSRFEAETITRNLINSPEMRNSKGILDIESLYLPPIQAFRYRFTSASGWLTILQLANKNWLVISSYNGKFVAKIFPDEPELSYKKMFSILKKPLEMKEFIVEGYRPDIVNRYYPDFNNKFKSKKHLYRYGSEQFELDNFIGMLHGTGITGSSIKIDISKDIYSVVKTSSYEFIISSLDKDLHGFADVLKSANNYSGLFHHIATFIVPFYDVIYKSVTDDEYELNDEDIVSIVIDAIDIVITVVTAGIAMSASIGKSIAESTARLSKSGLTKLALKRAVLKDLLTNKIISKSAISGLAHFVDDIINPVPYQAIYYLFKKTTWLKLSKPFKTASKDMQLADLISRGGGDFSFGLRSNFVDKMKWSEFKISKPRDLIKSESAGKFKDIYSSKNNPEQHFIKYKNDYFSVKYDEVFETWRVQSPGHLDSYQHSFPIERQGEKWIPSQHLNLPASGQKHHIKNNDVFTDEATKRLGENGVNKATIKGDLYQPDGPDKDFLYYSDNADMYIKNNNNEYYDFEYLAPDKDVAFIGKRGEKRLTVIYNRDKQKFDIINSYWDDGGEVIIKGSQGNISKTLSYNPDTGLYTLKTDAEDILLEYDDMRNVLKKSYVTGVTRLKGNVWRKEYDNFVIYEGSSTNSRLFIDGHGGETDTYLASEFNIPAGSQFNFYAPHGKTLVITKNTLEDFVKNKYEYAQSLTGGQKSPDYILSFFEDPVSFREIAQRNQANILQIKQGHAVRLSEVMHQVAKKTGRPYTQFDIAICRPRSGLSGFLPSGDYRARERTR